MISKRVIASEGALRLAQTAIAEAEARGVAVAVCVTDEGGHVLALRRMDRAGPATAPAAEAKARAAAGFGAPTKLFEDFVMGGQTAFLGLPGCVPLEGGLPILVEGAVAGAVGVAGAPSHIDGEIAADALAKVPMGAATDR